MGNTRTFVRLVAFVGALFTLGASQAEAGISSALIRALRRPILRTAMVAGLEGRALFSRYSAAGVVAKPHNATIWAQQSSDWVKALEQSAGTAAAEEAYLRFIRLEDRFRRRVGHGSNVERGERVLPANEITILQILARDEFALRQPGQVERFLGQHGLGPDVDSELSFLSGGSASRPLDRALQVLRAYAARRPAGHALYDTYEGQQVFKAVFGAEGCRGCAVDPVVSLVRALERSPEKGELTIELAYRLQRMLGTYDSLRGQIGFAEKGKLYHAIVNRLAKDTLASKGINGDGSLEFLPIKLR